MDKEEHLQPDLIIMPEELRAAIAVMWGNGQEIQAQFFKKSDVFNISNQILKAEVLRRKKEMEYAREHPRAGYRVEGEGIFVVQYEPCDRYGRQIGKVFNVYAAPEDLIDDHGNTVVARYGGSVQYVARLQNWHGFNGGYYANDIELHNALKSGKYHGEWVIPPSEALAGYDINGKRVKIDNLYKLRNVGDLAGTFTEENKKGGLSGPDRYWSCTDFGHANPDYSLCIKFSDGCFTAERKTFLALSCRPVRFVEVKR